jgi:sugar transferase (PEP-CTERM/EpsH1 system associated)
MRVLYLTHRLPYAPNRGDRIRAYHMLRELSRWADVELFSLVHDDEEMAHAAEVPFASSVVTARVPHVGNHIRGALRLTSSQPLTHSLLDSPEAREKLTAIVVAYRPDVVLAYCSSMARFAVEPPLDRLPFVLDMVDVDSQKWQRLSKQAAWPLSSVYSRETRTLAAAERAMSERARTVLVVSEHEREVLSQLAPRARIEVVPNGVDVESFRPTLPPAVEPVVVFTGRMDYRPNVEAVTWFAAQIWPHVVAARPDARFVIVGDRPARPVRTLAERDRSIQVTGRVGAVQPHLWRSAVAVAPLLTARGLQNKVMESLAAGVPVVLTPGVLAGLPHGVEKGCSVADGADAWIKAVLDMLSLSPAARRSLAQASQVDALSWSAQLAGLPSILRAAVAREGFQAAAFRAG